MKPMLESWLIARPLPLVASPSLLPSIRTVTPIVASPGLMRQPGLMRESGRVSRRAWYHLNLLTPSGRILARDEFQAPDDASAITTAALIADACSDRCSAHELWRGE